MTTGAVTYVVTAAQWRRMIWPRYASGRRKSLDEMSESELQWALRMLRTRKLK